MFKRLIKILVTTSMLLSKQSFAFGLGMGQVAQNITFPLMVAGDFVRSGSIMIGAAFLFAAVIRYFDHRRSPLMVPISTVVFLVVAGVALIGLPLLKTLS